MNNGVVSGSGRLDLNASALAAARRRLTGGDDQRLDGNGIIYDVEHQSQTTEKERILRTLAQMDGRSSVRNNAAAHTQAVMRRRAAVQQRALNVNHAANSASLTNHVGQVNAAALRANRSAQTAQPARTQLNRLEQPERPATSVAHATSGANHATQPAPSVYAGVPPVHRAGLVQSRPSARVAESAAPVKAAAETPDVIKAALRKLNAASAHDANSTRAAGTVSATRNTQAATTVAAHAKSSASAVPAAASRVTSVKSHTTSTASAAQTAQRATSAASAKAAAVAPAAQFPKISQHRGRIADTAPLALRSVFGAGTVAYPASYRVASTVAPEAKPAKAQAQAAKDTPVVQAAQPAQVAQAAQPVDDFMPDFIDFATEAKAKPAKAATHTAEATSATKTAKTTKAKATPEAAESKSVAKSEAKPAKAKTEAKKPAVTAASDPFAPLNLGHETPKPSVKDKAKASLAKVKHAAKSAHSKVKQTTKHAAAKLKAIKVVKPTLKCATKATKSAAKATRAAQPVTQVASLATSVAAATAQPQLAMATAATTGATSVTRATNTAAHAARKAAPNITKAEPFSIASDGAAVIAQPNFFDRLASTKIAFSFKFNRARTMMIVRYVAIAIVLGASAYLAWDTYNTNRGVQSSFESPAQAMSIAGVNPATADQTAVSNNDRQAYTVASDLPRIINIPAINVTARVRTVGVNSRGDIDTPKNLNDTAWYDGSSKPNQEGQVFIDGHTSFSRNIAAAFNDLNKVRDGDQIFIETGNGAKFRYRVTGVETVDANKVDMGKVLNTQDGAHKGLTLMTCTGTFNYRTQTADKRLIVYAVQEEDRS